jgi:hypothetical protein
MFYSLFLEPSTHRFPLHDFAHETLRYLVDIVPLYVVFFLFSFKIFFLFVLYRASTLLCPIAEQHFPFMTKEITIQITYIKNLLRSLSYLTIQRLRFLEIILSKLLRLDVNFLPKKSISNFLLLKVHASRQDIIREEKSNIETELVFSLEQLDTNDNNPNVMKHDQADKLDCLMYVMFEYITSICIENGKRFEF